MEDGQPDHRQRRQPQPPIATTGCGGLPRGGPRRDHDGAGCGGRRTWKDALLGRSRAPATAGTKEVAPSGHRHRSRSPQERRCSGSKRGRRGHSRHPDAATPPAPALASIIVVPDPVEKFFATAKRPTLPTSQADCMAADLEAEVEEVVATPLDFHCGHQSTPAQGLAPADAFGPTLSGPNSSPGKFNCHTPEQARTVAVQLGAVTHQIEQLEIEEDDSSCAPHHLFKELQPPIIASEPAPRSSAPPKSRATSAPSRQSARQAAASSTVPVSHQLGIDENGILSNF